MSTLAQQSADKAAEYNEKNEDAKQELDDAREAYDDAVRGDAYADAIEAAERDDLEWSLLFSHLRLGSFRCCV